ncbi:lysozyme inhibitor LprI family protein [Nevskia soli]|uniref:lysozyme inhibitor LprI family protein n=1 Tax=Nevskia soli TaxID=418856 RepID=UPI0012FBDDF0|nr:lysozyme inhibitor LprI family protein [Nevskia soli]
MILRSLLITISLIPSTVLAQGLRCDSKALSATETTICGDYDLKALDQKLNMAFRAATKVSADAPGLRGSQQTWLKAVRDQCKDKACLMPAYQQRIADLDTAFLDQAKVIDTALDGREVAELCRSVAAAADQGRIQEFAVPGVAPNTVTDGSTQRWGLTNKDVEQLPRDSGEFEELYRLRPSRQRPPERFARVFTGGTCAAYNLVNVERHLRAGPDARDVEDVDDPDEEIRWAYWGGGDFPIFYKGRNLVITSDLSDPNKVNMVSWIQPDGTQRPLCLLEVTNTQRTVTTARNPALCSGIAGGTIKPLGWERITERLPLSHDTATYREDFVRRYGDYADDVSLLRIDIDGSGTQQNIGAFEYASGAGCGSDHGWLHVISDDFGAIVDNPLNTVLGGFSGSFDVYRFQGGIYLGDQDGRHVDEVVRLKGDHVEQVCAFGKKVTTSVKRLFPLAAGGTQ